MLHVCVRCVLLLLLLAVVLRSAIGDEREERLLLLQRLWRRRQRDRQTRNRTLFSWSPATVASRLSDLPLSPVSIVRGTSTVAADARYDRSGDNTLSVADDRALFDWSAVGTGSASVSSTHSSVVAHEGDLRLSGGHGSHEGNIEVLHAGRWGYVCDDDWDIYDADVVCRQLGFAAALKPTHDGFFGHPRQALFWMDNTYCTGTETKLVDCRSEGWGINDCSSSEIAGVSCRGGHGEDSKATLRTTSLDAELSGKTHSWPNGRIQVRLQGGQHVREGRVELRTAYGLWGTVCGDGWGLLQANVACQTLGYGFAASAPQTGQFGGEFTAKVASGVVCMGNESSLVDCWHDRIVSCPGDPTANMAATICEPLMADLVPNVQLLQDTAYLEDKQMFYLQCAMEENCLAPDAYTIKSEDRNWHLSPRRLLRFTTRVLNAGSSAFRPFLPKQAWEWHACHMHYHSMEVFSTYDLKDADGRRVAEGHKASFCLEDSHCLPGVSPVYNCANLGDQGISVGCADSYAHNIDCQWIDITGLPPGSYRLHVVVNGEFKVGEQTWENNAATCRFEYTGRSGSVSDCRLSRP